MLVDGIACYEVHRVQGLLLDIACSVDTYCLDAWPLHIINQCQCQVAFSPLLGSVADIGIDQERGGSLQSAFRVGIYPAFRKDDVCIHI